MTDDRSLERAARSFIEPGPTRAPEAALERALLLIQATSQERDFRIPRRFSTMTTPARVAAAAVVGVLAIGGAALLFRPGPDVGTFASSPPPSHPIATGSPSPAATAQAPILDGTYATAPIKVADIVALINADSRLTGAQRTHLINVSFEIKDHTTFAVSVDLQNGQWTQHQSVDGVDQVGSRATYSFLDANTLIIRDQFGLGGFEITPVENGFSLKALSAEATEEDAITDKILFESKPFIRVP
jgi:hypothetical protein